MARTGPTEVDEVLPGSARRWAGALITPTDGRAEPQLATPAMAEGARRAGAAILTSCAVRGLETTDGRVSAAVTEHGRIDCGAVVLAGGAWSRLFAGNIGIDFPQLKILGSVMRTAPLEGAPELSVGGAGFSFRKRLDGGYTVARRNANVTPITPDHFRLFLRFPGGASSRSGTFPDTGRWTTHRRSKPSACSIPPLTMRSSTRENPTWRWPFPCSRMSRSCSDGRG